ncbi:hypothetical protein SAMN05216480_1142 [Pustulibacterium marinum]|uniref:Uncharacterized protein n=1 Tax=Pustulibacterium marinum TaxID=1224947 RepID=A0A1I7I9I4_9FLAO|nr:hypothetical protein SAMN05216480_1142 [Pustulibacterium marinum]
MRDDFKLKFCIDSLMRTTSYIKHSLSYLKKGSVYHLLFLLVSEQGY